MGVMNVQRDDIEGTPYDSVLVVDDEPQVAWVLRFSLEHEGYRTYTASNGVEAMEELQKHHPMLMVLDLMMPEMDGRRALVPTTGCRARSPARTTRPRPPPSERTRSSRSRSMSRS